MHDRPGRHLARILVAALALSGLVLVSQSPASAAPVRGAVSTTTNLDAQTGSCLNGKPDVEPVNCNLYAAKQDVWLSGLPDSAHVNDGTYVFAVLKPSGQPDINGDDLLSTDTIADRTFSITNGVVSYPGPHGFSANKVQLTPYLDTSNPGGVYILAVCHLDDGTTASDCKYDAFKVRDFDDEPPTDPGTRNLDPLTISKTAAGTYTTTYPWTLSKAVTTDALVKKVGENATFGYEVALTKGNGTNSAIAVTGTITVTNPNTGYPVEADVTDQLTSGEDCAVRGGTDAVIEPGDNEFHYTCTIPGSTLPNDRHNTATVTWDTQNYDPPNAAVITGDSDFTEVAYSFSQNETDECVDVSDLFTPAAGSQAGDVPDGQQCSSRTYDYTRTVPVPADGCQTYDNAASFQTGDTKVGDADTTDDTASVTVCGPVKTGALTMGFWQNKNGQAMIGSSKSDTCASVAWLRQFAPFQDLSANATCFQVGAYDADVFKKASAAGASMNAMLKSQMLATALDVYFSDPALGGNKIGAPHPIGGVAIDLTQVCKNIGSCTVFEPTSAAFGGATSLTVKQMLCYAGSRSNSGGTTWYAATSTLTLKAIQELAKDSFDAINNQVAFAP